MDYFSSNDSNHQTNTPNVFALFAKTMGIFSIFCAVFSIFFLSFICGGLAIILAVLSKGYQKKMEKNALIGLACGVVGVTLQIFILTAGFYSIIKIPEFREYFNSVYEQMYGEPLNDSINEMLDELGSPQQKGGFL